MSYFYFIEETSSTSVNGGMPFMHSHPAYELYFLLEGEKSYITSSSIVNFQKNTLVITAPLVLHKFERGPYRRILITLHPDDLSPSQRDFLNMLATNDIMTFDDKHMRIIKNILEHMLKIFNTPTKDSKTIFFLQLGKLFAYIYRYGKQPDSSLRLENNPEPLAVTPTIMKVLDYVNEHFTEKFSLDFLAKEFNISKTWLIKCFTHATQMTVIEYKLNLQINKAKNLLVSTDKSLERIAKECGFSSANYFGMIFKKYIGVSPKNYCKKRGKTPSSKQQP